MFRVVINTEEHWLCSITSEHGTIFVRNNKRVSFGNFEFKSYIYWNIIYFSVYSKNNLWLHLLSKSKYCEFNLNDEANRVCDFNPDKFILRYLV